MLMLPPRDPLCWARLNHRSAQRFAKRGLRAALRLDRQEFREWLMRRLIEPPLAAPVDPASFAISQADIALLMAGLARSRRPQAHEWARAAFQPAPTARSAQTGASLPQAQSG